MQEPIRTLRRDEMPEVLQLLAEAHGSFYDQTETRLFLSSQRFDPDGCFVKEDDGSLTACVAVTRLPRDRWFVIRFLTVRDAKSKVDVAEILLERAIQYSKSKSEEFLRATTPATEPYPTIYRRFGFKPLRRDFRIGWDLGNLDLGKSEFSFRELDSDTVDEAAGAYVESLRPHWDWRTEEHGGPAAVASYFKEGVSLGERWFACQVKGRMVGFTGLIPDFYGSGKARFRGTSVLPEYRGKGIGSALMHEIIRFAKSLGQNGMVVYTFSYLDHLAPGASLYLKSGGRIEAEYLQLQM